MPHAETMTIRLATPADAAGMAAVYRPYVVELATSFEQDPPDEPEMARRIEAVLAWAPWLACTDGSDQILGYAYAARHRERAAYAWSVDVAIYIRREHQRRGLGRALYRALFPLLSLQGFYTAHAGVTLPNPGSVALHESFGFRPVGVYPAVGWKHGAWRDVGWWQLPLRGRREGQSEEKPEAPAPPLPLPIARALPQWPASLDRGLRLSS